MADINTEVSKIRVAIYGEEVRDSIADALVKVNNDVIDTDSGIGTKQNGTYISASNTVAQDLKALDTAAQGLASGPIRNGDTYPATSAKFIDNTNEGNYAFVEGKANVIDPDILPVANPPLNFAHAEGYGNMVYNQGGHAEGYENIVWGHWGHAEGHNNRTGGVETYAVPGNTSSEMTPPSSTNSYDHAEGNSNVASGGSSHAEGYGTKATASCAHSEGSGTTASGYQSHAEGSTTTASEQCAHAEGYGAIASGTYSHAEGYMTEATDTCTHAEGNDTEASGSNSHAEGFQSVASGSMSHAEGSSTASNAYAHSEGSGTTASAAMSHAEGNGTTASGSSSHAEGNGTWAKNAGSHAEGSNTQSEGASAHAEGDHTNAEGPASHAEGYYSQVLSSSTFISSASSSEGTASYAGGYYNFVKWAASFAHGIQNKIDIVASSSDPNYNPNRTVSGLVPKFVIGRYNAWEYEDFQNVAFAIGNGTTDQLRSNAFVVDYSGNATLAGTLTVAADPTSNYEVATKHYVDDICGSINTALEAILGGSSS